MSAVSRLTHIDLLKGFAILLVVMGHTMWISIGKYTPPLFEVLATIHMPLFVTLSGFFATKPLNISMGGVVSYWISRLCRLILPLLILPALFQYIRYGELNLPLVSIISEYWFTYALFLVFIVFYSFRLLALLCRDYCEERLFLWLEPLLALLSIFTLRACIDFADDFVPNLGKVYWLYKYFLIGYFVGKHKELQAMLVSELAGCVSGLLLLISIVLHFYLGLEFQYGVSPLVSVANLMAVSAFAFAFYVAYRLSGEPPTKLKDVFVYLGKQSLGIYLVHYFFLFDMSWLRPYFDAIASSHLRLGADVLVSLGLSLLVLVPTLLVVSWIQTNRYLAFLLLGEPLPKKRD